MCVCVCVWGGGRLHWRVQGSTSSPTGIGSRRRVAQFRRPPKNKDMWSYTRFKHAVVGSMKLHATAKAADHLSGMGHFTFTYYTTLLLSKLDTHRVACNNP